MIKINNEIEYLGMEASLSPELAKKLRLEFSDMEIKGLLPYAKKKIVLDEHELAMAA